MDRALVDRADELFSGGLNAARVRRALLQPTMKDGAGNVIAVAHAKTPLQASDAIAATYRRWDQEDAEDAPHRRIRMLRTAEAFFTRQVADKKATAALGALRELLRSAGAFRQHDQEKRAEITQYVGELPSDPAGANIYAHRAMSFLLRETLMNVSLDPITRIRLVADIGAKIGMTYNKAQMEDKADRIQRLLSATDESNPDELEPTDGLRFPPTSRFGEPSEGDGPLSGDEPDPEEEDDG